MSYVLDEEGYACVLYAPRPTPTEGALMSTVCFQQVNIGFGRKLMERLQAKLRGDILLTVSELREMGFSERKAETILRIKKFFDVLIYTPGRAYVPNKMPSVEVVKMFTTIKGVGDWTVKAYLLFTEQRSDIALYEDLDVRKGLKLHHKLEKLPNPKQAKDLVKDWPVGEASKLSYFYLQLGKLCGRQ
jgi:3-methyladenine DNA glycosylase/8-oxoguanine DNA glycosylase